MVQSHLLRLSIVIPILVSFSLEWNQYDAFVLLPLDELVLVLLVLAVHLDLAEVLLLDLEHMCLLNVVLLQLELVHHLTMQAVQSLVGVLAASHHGLGL